MDVDMRAIRMGRIYVFRDRWDVGDRRRACISKVVQGALRAEGDAGGKDGVLGSGVWGLLFGL